MAVILAEKYGQQPWILQCMNGIQECVQNSVEMLSGAPPQANALGLHQGGQYQFAARTAAELQATQAQVADNGQVSQASVQQQVAAQQADAAMAAGNVDMCAQRHRAAGMQDPATGQGPPQQQEAPSEPGSDKWIL